MTPNVGGMDRTLRIVAGLALLSLFFVLEGNARYWGLIWHRADPDRHVPLVPGVPAVRHQHLFDEERLNRPPPATARRERAGARVLALSHSVGRQPAPHRRGIHRTGVPCDLTAAPEYHQGRNAADAVARGHVLRLVRVQLGESRRRLDFGGDALEDRRHGPTRAAPGRPEVDDDGHAGLRHVTVETGAVSSTGCPMNSGSWQRGQCGWSCSRLVGTRTTTSQRWQTTGVHGIGAGRGVAHGFFSARKLGWIASMGPSAPKQARAGGPGLVSTSPATTSVGPRRLEALPSMRFKDYYDVMGVPRGATQDEIKRAYRKLARKFHPDVSKEKNAEDRFKELQEANEVLKDPEKRVAYDQLGADWRQGQEFRPPPDWGKGFEFTPGRGGRGTQSPGGSPAPTSATSSPNCSALAARLAALKASILGRGGAGHSTRRRARITLRASRSISRTPIAAARARSTCARPRSHRMATSRRSRARCAYRSRPGSSRDSRSGWLARAVRAQAVARGATSFSR